MMMKTMKIAAVVVFSATLAGAAAADLIAGWDFSQYQTSGSLDTGAGAVYTLPANYSESGIGGTMFIDGTFGSTDASGGGLVSAGASDTKVGQNGPYKVSSDRILPIQTFDSLSTKLAEGQPFAERLGLTTTGAASVVFGAALGAPDTRGWRVNFAAYIREAYNSPARLVPTKETVDVDVFFAAPCGGGYSLIDTVTLLRQQQEFFVHLEDSVLADSGCVRLDLTHDVEDFQLVIDNVAVPEPGAAAGMVAGVLALAGLVRRRA